MDNHQFYDHVPIISTFLEVVDDHRYSPLPNDWHIIVTDIRSSTGAISRGKYKEVNMAGASVITAICNEFSDLKLPFVFGGDGATIAIPNLDMDRVHGILKFCKTAVKNAYGLELSAGSIQVKEIREQGYDVSLAKYRLSDLIQQAIFWGDGVSYAEEFIKSDSYTMRDVPPIEADFSGLECRWNRFPAKKDEIVAIIVRVMTTDQQEKSELYKFCLQKIEEIYGREDEAKPVTIDQLSLTGNPRFLNVEIKLRTEPSTLFKKIKYGLKVAYMQLAGRYLMKNSIETKNTRWGDYKKDFIRHADFRKFSDTLKLVITGSVDQRTALKNEFEPLFKEGKIVYGLSSSQDAISTCYVTDYQGYHIHFIDGADGGYAKAAQELKLRLKSIDQN